MRPDPSVVISAAGRGRRLGLDLPKALVECAGRRLIEWQLDLCREIEDLIVVVGFQRAEVADLVLAHRPDALIVVNHEFDTTGTAASLRRGARMARARTVLSLDGDLLVHPNDWERLLDTAAPVLGIATTTSRDAVQVTLDRRGRVVAFVPSEQPGSTSISPFEWSGLCKMPKAFLESLGDGHIFPNLVTLLPLPAIELRSAELDYPEELEALEAFATTHLSGRFNAERRS